MRAYKVYIHNFLSNVEICPVLICPSPPAQHYNGDISELELYFVIVNNEYGEQSEEELLPGGRNMRVTNDNVITFIHLVANHRLNSQVKRLLLCYLLAWESFVK
jgi:ubiquitin-protein ligase E3 C